MKNFVLHGNYLPLVAPYAVSSGGGMLVGTLFGVATADADSGATVEAAMTGVFDLAKASGAITQGAAVYWDDTAKVVTTTATDNTRIGAAITGAGSSDLTARVRLDGVST